MGASGGVDGGRVDVPVGECLSSPVMDPYLREALNAIERTAGPLEVATIARRADGQWSISEILEHLTLAFAHHTSTLEKALASGEVRGRPPGFVQWLGRTLVIEFGYFPRAQAPVRTVPLGNIPPERSITSVREALEALDRTLARVSARFGDEALVSNHPFFRGLTVAQWRKFHWRHTVHHMRQISRQATE